MGRGSTTAVAVAGRILPRLYMYVCVVCVYYMFEYIVMTGCIRENCILLYTYIMWIYIHIYSMIEAQYMSECNTYYIGIYIPFI